MTAEEKKKLMEKFREPIVKNDDYYNWSEEELLDAAKRVAIKLGLKEPFYKGE